MTDKLYRVLLDLFMISDPWTLSKQARQTLEDELNQQAKLRGWNSWTLAYHELLKTERYRDEVQATFDASV